MKGRPDRDTSGAPLAEWLGLPVDEVRSRLGVPLLEVYGRIGSTNDRAGLLGRGGAPPYSVVVAEEQTDGRGRRGRAWMSPGGSGLLMSVLLPGSGRSPQAGTTLLVGLAVADAIEATTPYAEVRVKWPNDLLLDGRKVCGILCEATPSGVVAGIGVNLHGDPGADPEANAVSVAGAGLASPDPRELAAAIVTGLRARMTDGPAGDLGHAFADLDRRDALRGRPVVSEAEGDGVGAGVDRDGALLLRRLGGPVVRVTAGSVRLRD